MSDIWNSKREMTPEEVPIFYRAFREAFELLNEQPPTYDLLMDRVIDAPPQLSRPFRDRRQMKRFLRRIREKTGATRVRDQGPDRNRNVDAYMLRINWGCRSLFVHLTGVERVENRSPRRCADVIVERVALAAEFNRRMIAHSRSMLPCR